MPKAVSLHFLRDNIWAKRISFSSSLICLGFTQAQTICETHLLLLLAVEFLIITD